MKADLLMTFVALWLSILLILSQPDLPTDHSLAMAIAGVIVATAQRRAFRPYVNVRWWRVPLAVLTFIVAFWVGFYYFQLLGQPLDLDLVFGFTALGCSVWLGSFRVNEKSRVSVLFAALAFTIGCVIGQLLGILLFVSLGLTPQMLRDNMFVHAFYFMTVAISTGVVGGALSGKFLARALQIESQS